MEKDIDPQETAEWLESLEAVRRAAGPERAEYLLKRLATSSRYINTVPTSEEPGYPGDLELEERIAAYDRWNAAAMITRGSGSGSAAIWPPMPRPPGCTRSGSTISSTAVMTRCTSRATRPRASTPARSWRDG
ncbi:hypothetical protein ACFQX6_09470 [Streptosporangium lutulentum]